MLLAGDQTERKSINKATKRVLTVLQAFIASNEPLGPSELARRLDMSRNMVYRALATLEKEGFLFRVENTGRFILSNNISQLQNATNPPPNFRTMATPYIEKIAHLTGETVQLLVLSEDVAVVIDGIESTNALSLAVKFGHAIPLHVSVGSRAVLAALPDEEIESYYRRNKPLKSYTATSITKLAELKKEVALIREEGFARSFGDYSPTTAGFAYSILDSDGKPHGAVGVGGPRQRISDEWCDEMREKVRPWIDELRMIAALYEAD